SCFTCRQPDCPHEPCASQCLQHPPAGIPFVRRQSEPRPAWERVMIVVPAFAHRQQREEADVASLHCRAADFAHQLAVVVREMPDEPMAEDCGGDARAYTPENECPA